MFVCKIPESESLQRIAELIFTPFEQAEGSSKRRHQGAGLGLAISGQLVAMMGGRIWLDTEFGVGSTFHFTVRLGLTRQVPHSVQPPVVLPLSGLRVLVTDENATSRRVLEELLRGWGMVPSSVETGPAAIDALRKGQSIGEPFGLVLMDSRMPDMDGPLAAEIIRHEPGLENTPVILLGPPFAQSDSPTGLGHPVACLISKPVRPSEVMVPLF